MSKWYSNQDFKDQCGRDIGAWCLLGFLYVGYLVGCKRIMKVGAGGIVAELGYM